MYGNIIFRINADPRVRHTVWSQSIGGMFQLVSLVGANQIIIQRYLCIEKTSHAQMLVNTSNINVLPNILY